MYTMPLGEKGTHSFDLLFKGIESEKKARRRRAFFCAGGLTNGDKIQRI